MCALLDSIKKAPKNRGLVAEGVGFEPTCPKDKRFSRPPRYDRFDNPPYMNCRQADFIRYSIFSNFTRPALSRCCGVTKAGAQRRLGLGARCLVALIYYTAIGCLCQEEKGKSSHFGQQTLDTLPPSSCRFYTQIARPDRARAKRRRTRVHVNRHPRSPPPFSK